MVRFARSLPALGLALAGVLLLAGCAGSRDARTTAPEPETEPEMIELAEVETFDVTPYREEPPELNVGVQHNVPEELIEGRAAQGLRVTVEGYRIQLLSSVEKQAADELYTEAQAWWEALYSRVDSLEQVHGPDSPVVPDIPDFGPTLPIDIVYRQPYYRVRVGSFRSRTQADAARRFLVDRFPNAFVVPDRVTVTR